MILQGSLKTPVREVVLHCAAIKSGKFSNKTALEVFSIINRWHHERGFRNGFGYHGLFMPDGSFFHGRPYHMEGAHVIGHNRGTLGFLLIESREIDRIGTFDDWFTPQQRVALRARLADLRADHGIQRVTGHNDYGRKLCPGFHVKSSDWL